MCQIDYVYQNIEKFDLADKADNLMNRNFMLIYGSLDSTVNPQQSILFEKQLVANNIVYHQLVSTTFDLRI